MLKILNIALLGSLLLLGAAKPVSGESSPFSALFCPECWTYLWGGGALDMKGNCAECGKYPVELEARRLSWAWCAEQQKWNATACERHAPTQCGEQEESIALVVGPGPGPFEAWYCPEHRSFRVLRLPILMQRVCATCARPAVKVLAVERSWYWCMNAGQWVSEACPMNAVTGCCAKRGGTLLAYPEFGPLAR